MGEFSEYAGGAPAAAPAARGEFAEFAEPAAEPARSAIPGIDMGPAGRRARSGGNYMPPRRDLTAEEAGTMAGPMKHGFATLSGKAPTGPIGRAFTPLLGEVTQEPAPADRRDASITRLPLPGGGVRLTAGPEFGEMSDPLVQIGTATAMGMGAGAGAGYLAGAANLPRVGAVLAPAVEGGVANKSAGGDFSTGALLGGAVPALRAGRTAAREFAAAAPARVQTRIEKNLGENVKHKTADKVTAVAKKGDLREVVDRNPELREALAIHAESKPAKALEAVQETKAKAMARRDADFDRIEAYYADKPPSSQATVAGILDEYDALLLKNPGDVERMAVLERARTQVTKMGDRLRKSQGLPPAVEGDYSGTVVSPKDLRDFEGSIGRQAYEMGTPTSTKRKVNADLYRPIARQVHALAEGTPGVNAKKFAETGKDIHVLIPVEEALAYKADKLRQGKKPFMERMANIAHAVAHVPAAIAGHSAGGAVGAIIGLTAPTAARAAGSAAARAGRRIDYRLAQRAERAPAALLREGPPDIVARLAPPMPGQLPAREQERGYAGRVAAGMAAGQSLKDAVDAADEAD